MKSYNGTTRNMMKIGNKSKALLEKLKGQEIFEMINEDNRLSKHKIGISFNQPDDVRYTELKVYLFGEHTTSVVNDGKAFIESLGDKIKPPSQKEDIAEIFAEFTLSMKPGNKEKYEAFAKKYQALVDELNPSVENDDGFMKFSATDDKIIIKLFVYGPKSELPFQVPDFPDNLKHALKDIDQHINLKIELGVDAEDLLGNDRPLIQQLMRGFSVNLEFQFFQNIQKAIEKEFEGGDEMIGKYLGLASPAFGLSSNISLELEYDDFEKLKNHPMAKQLLITLDEFTTATI